MTITITDLFAGAGGSSTGARDVPGVEVRAASNHWKLAVDVHEQNHPDALHLCADISQVNPRLFPSTDVLWASPECTNHSKAKGRRREQTLQPDLFGETLPSEAAERSRATMWDVVRFTEMHRYQSVIVENVVEAYLWEPFQAWLMAMQSMGYAHQIVYLNSMHAQALGLPAPQSRDRMYVCFYQKGNTRPDFDRWLRPRAYCTGCDEIIDAIQAWKKPDRPWGRYRQQYVYRCPKISCRNQVVEPAWLPAATAIDWNLLGQRIGDRERPLKDKTRRRIAVGIARYWSPLQIEAAGHTYDAADPKHVSYGDPNAYYRAWPMDQTLKTLHTIESKALVVPVEGRDGKEASTTTNPLRTQTTRHENALAMPAFIAELRGGGSTARPADHPLATVTASGNHHGLVTTRDPYSLLAPYYGNAESAYPSTRPVGTLTTRDRYALITNTAKVSAEDVAAAEAHVDDCLFRMLEPTEVAAGMAFPGAYAWKGTRRERVRMAGNAVTPPASRDLIGCVVESLT